VGIRPEDMGIGEGSHSTIKAKVEMISNVGSENYIHARLGQESLTVRAPKDINIQPGQVIPLTILPQQLHIFHKGRRI